MGFIFFHRFSIVDGIFHSLGAGLVATATGEHGQTADPSVASPVPEPAAELTLDDLKAVRQKHGGNSGEYNDCLAKYKKQELEKAKKKLQAKITLLLFLMQHMQLVTLLLNQKEETKLQVIIKLWLRLIFKKKPFYKVFLKPQFGALFLYLCIKFYYEVDTTYYRSSFHCICRNCH